MIQLNFNHAGPSCFAWFVRILRIDSKFWCCPLPHLNNKKQHTHTTNKKHIAMRTHMGHMEHAPRHGLPPEPARVAALQKPPPRPERAACPSRCLPNVATPSTYFAAGRFLAAFDFLSPSRFQYLSIPFFSTFSFIQLIRSSSLTLNSILGQLCAKIIVFSSHAVWLMLTRFFTSVFT